MGLIIAKGISKGSSKRVRAHIQPISVSENLAFEPSNRRQSSTENFDG